MNAVLLLAAVFVSRRLLASKLGRLLLALRDKEERVRFSGYDVANLKTFVVRVRGGAGGRGRGHVHAAGGIHVALVRRHRARPSRWSSPSAVGGRESLLGAVYGTLVVNFGKTFFSERFPQLWLFLIGALFIAVVMIFPERSGRDASARGEGAVREAATAVRAAGYAEGARGYPPLSSATMGTEHSS